MRCEPSCYTERFKETVNFYIETLTVTLANTFLYTLFLAHGGVRNTRTHYSLFAAFIHPFPGGYMFLFSQQWCIQIKTLRQTSLYLKWKRWLHTTGTDPGSVGTHTHTRTKKKLKRCKKRTLCKNNILKNPVFNHFFHVLDFD